MKKWYLLKAKPRQEQIAVTNLEIQGFKTFCPFFLIKKKRVVLFPGYIFIHLDNKNENWSPIRSTRGVLNFVRFGLNFAQVPDNVIEYIKKNQQTTYEKLKNLNKFKPGDKILITEGVFKSCTAIFKSSRADDRFILLMNILGQEQSININKDYTMAL